MDVDKWQYFVATCPISSACQCLFPKRYDLFPKDLSAVGFLSKLYEPRVSSIKKKKKQKKSTNTLTVF